MPTRPRPTIKPWLPRLWRDPQTFQIGTEPDNGVLISGVDLAAATWLAGLDGSRSEAEVLSDASALGLELSSAVRILSSLSLAGVLLNAPLDAEQLASGGPLLPELVGLTEAAPTSSIGGEVLAARAQRHVVIDGANRIGVSLGSLLAASGVGGLTFLDTTTVRCCDAGVGGLDLADEGAPSSLAAQRAVRRASAGVRILPLPASGRADLLVLCRPWTAHDPLLGQGLLDRGAHMPVAVREARIVIGPLVVPGRTSCLRCAELHRTDRDPRWPAAAAQLAAGPSRAINEPASVLAALAAGLAAGQALEFLDDLRVPEVVDATLELRPPDWQLHRRPWLPHADCGCVQVSADGLTATA